MADNYTIEDSLHRIADESLARAMVSGSNQSQDYSFLPQVSGVKVVGTPQRQMSLEEQFGSSLTPSSGGMSSIYSTSRGYADYPTIPMPTLSPIETPTLTAPELPTYTAPERDEKRLQSLQQKAAAPGLQRLRRGLDKGIQSTRSIDNPTERKFHLSGMLEQYGLGLGDIISKADMTGLNEYEREYATQLDQAKTRYGADVHEATSKASVENQNLINRYQQELADRNAMFALESQLFGKQGIQKIAEAYKDANTGLSRTGLSRYSFR